MTDLTALAPPEIDALWAEAKAPIDAKFQRSYSLREKAAAYAKRAEHDAYYAPRAADTLAAADRLRGEARAALPTLAPFEAEWNRRGGWTRAYLVPGGHVHRSTNCSSLYPTTLISWLPEQSGWDEDAIVEAAGVHACTICYSSAPVDALRAAEAEAKRKLQCSGSGTWDHDSSGLRYYSPRARCNHCGQTVSATSTGKLRAHKPKS